MLAGEADAVSEAMPGFRSAAGLDTRSAARDRGYRIVRFFPAGPDGGPKSLRAFASPLGGMVFCPTGGVSLDNAPDYLNLNDVVCVGGCWVAPADAVRDGDWARDEKLAREMASIAVGSSWGHARRFAPAHKRWRAKLTRCGAGPRHRWPVVASETIKDIFVRLVGR
jgi:2-dehydro-3-deoxyphosphogluconate aldolase/(4S)-4-hydroxy-2-oxoglutarate aldolase